jgi:predicted metallopeptidase
MPRMVYHRCPQLSSFFDNIVSMLGLDHLLNSSIAFVVSKGSRSRAIARIYGLPRAIQEAHGLRPLYTIEFLCEKIDNLESMTFGTVFVHELLHIPSNSMGGLRPHGKLVNNRLAKKIAKRFPSKVWGEALNITRDCCTRITEP